MITKGQGVDLDIKAVSDEGELAGYAAVFGNRDATGDIVAPGAFAASLKATPPGRVKMLLSHSPEQPVGIWDELREDDRGLYARGRLILETQRGREVHALLRAGALDALSIGFRSVKDRFDRTRNARIIEQVELAEISIVSFPANSLALIESVKAADHARARAIMMACQRVKEAHFS